MDVTHWNKKCLNKLMYFNGILHLLGLFVAFFFMKQGTPLVSLEERLNYLSHSPLYWQWSWGIWMLCALALLLFMTGILLSLFNQISFISYFALFCVASGVSIDLLCDTIYIVLLPTLAKNYLNSPELFYTFERLTSAGGVIVANGLYSLGILCITLDLKRLSFSKTILFTGYATFIFGMLMVVSGFLNHTKLLELSTGPTMLSFLLWTFLLSREIEKR